ncbi:hypothetical protein EVB32_069 [Rhizobium phage RHph_TM39]|uniref:Uncharacterized protein n=1 Tax=Rhizobium phage RHph_TM30 TaxID=2509764 RepID=A0A7S5R9D5_9CAUD|nr:hypothetical protein PQC16_gp069 [Rhizobium phage RHph_TM30]QIG71540.1 hypothetical protein EVB94_069 [Rhizobium phage RHph_TM40]QIG71903.1 hypothetical protein EVB95_069 [Rhizobium phage RHph_TM2_3B]QIG72265.1 hypothetical protein EVB96_069 [Rhizobium phage RHph_TM3_3_6]QIG77057.1 hypothetical protein EVB32_069 [Rhizobium phage RHph_TM39]QIG77656.1 hypothetical protein EVB64_069 [Rhizobium phage RHph_TM61]
MQLDVALFESHRIAVITKAIIDCGRVNGALMFQLIDSEEEFLIVDPQLIITVGPHRLSGVDEMTCVRNYDALKVNLNTLRVVRVH